jgi:molybdopterin/thiamine biosynthesis adenylyltransferase
MMTKSVAIVGCGAVGSFLADQVATLGVGKIRLVDKETLADSNIHRHRLGINALQLNKAKALAMSLGRRLPHITVEAKDKGIEEVLLEDPDYVTKVDILAICLGDETLELRLNALLRNELKRLHVWVEPIGLGGHVLATGVAKSLGCYRCLFETTIRSGNQSALAAQGQWFQRSLAGCGGEFTPFPASSAQRVSLRASELIGDILLGLETTNLLISSMGNPAQFLARGFQLSARGKTFRPHEEQRVLEFGRRDCPDCGHLGS